MIVELVISLYLELFKKYKSSIFNQRSFLLLNHLIDNKVKIANYEIKDDDVVKLASIRDSILSERNSNTIEEVTFTEEINRIRSSNRSTRSQPDVNIVVDETINNIVIVLNTQQNENNNTESESGQSNANEYQFDSDELLNVQIESNVSNGIENNFIEKLIKSLKSEINSLNKTNLKLIISF